MKKFFIAFVLCLFIIGGFFYSAEIYADEAGNVLLRKKILIELSKSELSAEAVNTLNELAVLLNLYQKNLLVIEGHADSSGEKRYNQNLSNERAQAVFDFFDANSIDKNRMKIVPYGDSRPAKDNAAEEGRRENRRAEIIIFKAE
jgi:OOP family OmpA-OmpF porin